MARDNSVTEQVAEWIVKADYDDIPKIAVERVRNLVLDSLGNQFAGMSVSTGRILSEWVEAQGGTPESSVTGRGFKTTASLATRVNGAASHALENDDIATFSSHPNSPLTAAALALGEKLGASGRDFVLAWLVGWEITAQTMKPVMGPRGNELINRGWFNQGFQETLGVAALAARLLHLDHRDALRPLVSAQRSVPPRRGHMRCAREAGAAGVLAALTVLDLTGRRGMISL